MRGGLTHSQRDEETMQESALKQNGLRVSYLTICCSFSLDSKTTAAKSRGSVPLLSYSEPGVCRDPPPEVLVVYRRPCLNPNVDSGS